MNALELFERQVPRNLLDHSGSVFYSGCLAFSQPSELYVLGLNPGGCPSQMVHNTLRSHTRSLLTRDEPNWSAYRDESWGGAKAGTKGLAPRVLHMFEVLGKDAGLVPASNLIFMRTRRESCLAGDKEALAEACWPFHIAVIESLKPRIILCFGRTVGNFVANKMSAKKSAGVWVEDNHRRWATRAYSNGETVVIAATHPSIANWQSPAADPSSFIKGFLHG